MNFQRIKSFRSLFYQSGWYSELSYNNTVYKRIIDRSNLLLENKIIFDDPLDMEPCHIPYSIIDYKWNRYPGKDPEWCYMLNRQGFLVDLAISYKITGKEEYFLKYKELVFDFILSNGIPNSKNKNSWRSMDAGIRLQNLIKSFTYINIEDLLQSDELEILKKCIITHIIHLMDTYLERYDLSNWGVLSLSGLATVDLFFPELINEKTRKFIWEKLYKQLELQFYNDGLHWEQSPLYHHQVITALLYVVLISNYLNLKLPLEIDIKLRNPISSSYFYANKCDVLVPLNDSDRVNLSYVYNIYRHMGYLKSKPTNNDSIIFVGSLYEEKNKHVNSIDNNIIFAGGDSGFYAYKKDSIYFTLFNGLHGSGHGHASHGSFTLDINNKPFIIDSGRYTYMNHPLRFRLRKEAAHNSISIKGFPATKIRGSWGFHKLAEPLYHKYQNTQIGPLFSVSWSGRGPMNSLYIVQRTILYVEEFKTFIFYDKVQKKGWFPIKVEMNFNIDETVKIIKRKNKVIVFNNDELEVKLWSKKGSYKITNQMMSKIYNQKNKHKRISNCIKVFKSNFTTINTLTMDQNIVVTNEKVFEGSNFKKKKEIDYVEGIKLENANNSLKLFFLNNEVVKGDKYFKTSNQEGFYGSINVILQDGQVIKLK